VVTDNDIIAVLNDSDLDFSGDDCEGDPDFLPAELTQRTSYRETSESSSSDEDDALIHSPASAPAPEDRK